MLVIFFSSHRHARLPREIKKRGRPFRMLRNERGHCSRSQCMLPVITMARVLVRDRVREEKANPNTPQLE